MEITGSKGVKAVFFVLIISFISCLAYLGQLWPVLDRSARVSVVTATLSVLGTLFLATATFWTIQQNNRLIDVRTKEREKPIAREELENFIEPSIAITKSNSDAIESAKTREWVNMSPYKIFDINNRTAVLDREVQLVFLPADPYLRERISGESPDLIQTIDEHNDIVEQFADLREEIFQDIREEVEAHLRESGYENEFEPDEMEELLEAVFKELESYRQHPDFWKSEREDLIAILEESASENLNQLNSDRERYVTVCDSLQSQLTDRKKELMSEYGIVSEFDPEEDTIRAV